VKGDVAEIGAAVRAFYEAAPFPDYDAFETLQDLLDKARRGVYARMLDDALPLGIRILDAGCGTGQIGAFLSLGRRSVVGADFSRASLARGQAFAARFGLRDVRFVHMDLFHPCLRPGSFDLVMSNGVLHHTAAPEQAFRALCELVKPGGHILVGLYNPYGRLLNDVRRLIYRITGRRLGRLMWPRPMDGAKERAWFLDQYAHPHEVMVSVDEVLGWFRRAGLEYVSSVPPITPGVALGEAEDLFRARPSGGRLAHLLAQLGWIRALSREGGYFITIGREPAS
jgi:SAM-dependent methyltransferase